MVFVWHLLSHQLLAKIDVLGDGGVGGKGPTVGPLGGPLGELCANLEARAVHAVAFVRRPKDASRALVGAMLATGGADGVVRVWAFNESRHGVEVARAESPIEEQKVRSLATNKSGKWIVVGDEIGRVRSYAFRKRSQLVLEDSIQVFGPSVAVKSLAYIKSDKADVPTECVVAGGSDCRVVLLQVRRAEFGSGAKVQKVRVFERIGILGQGSLWGCDASVDAGAGLFSSSTLQHHGRTLRYPRHTDLDMDRLAKSPDALLRAQSDYEALVWASAPTDESDVEGREAYCGKWLVSPTSSSIEVRAVRQGYEADAWHSLGSMSLVKTLARPTPDVNALLAATQTSAWVPGKRGASYRPNERLFQLMPVDGDFDGGGKDDSDNGKEGEGEGKEEEEEGDDGEIGGRFVWFDREERSEEVVREEKRVLHRVLTDEEIRTSTKVLKCTIKFGELPRGKVEEKLFEEVDAHALANPEEDFVGLGARVEELEQVERRAAVRARIAKARRDLYLDQQRRKVKGRNVAHFLPPSSLATTYASSIRPKYACVFSDKYQGIASEQDVVYGIQVEDGDDRDYTWGDGRFE